MSNKSIITPLSADGNLTKYTKKNTSYFSLDGLEITAKCISVYDGDTINVIFKVPGFENTPTEGYFKHRLRLDGIDTPEIRGGSDAEKLRAVESRDFLRDIILHKYINIKLGIYDKYGRALATIFHNNININELLLEKNFAVPYNGGTKPKFVLRSNKSDSSEDDV
jgi:micrococcal nuclease